MLKVKMLIADALDQICFNCNGSALPGRVSIRKHLIGFQWAGAGQLNKAPLQPFVRSSPARQWPRLQILYFTAALLLPKTPNTAMLAPLCPSSALEQWNTKESRLFAVRD